MAQWSRDAFDVRCLGTIGGLIGAVVGFFVFIWFGNAIGMGLGSLALGLLGIPVGIIVGIRFTLGLLAR